MKLSSTTLGCPNWSLDQIIKNFKACGLDGIDFRGLGEPMDITVLPEFTSKVAETASKIRDGGLAVSGVSSSVRCVSESDEQRAEFVEETKRYCALAPKLGCATVRVFGGAIPEGMSDTDALQVAADNLRRYGEIAAEHGVKVALETHDDWCASTRVAELIKAADHPAVGVLWDVHHPWRVTGESGAESWANFGKWVIYTHFKDAKGRPGSEQQLCEYGQGDLPLADFVKALREGGYDGWYTFEHEKRWHAELADPEEEFPRYVKVMRGLA